MHDCVTVAAWSVLYLQRRSAYEDVFTEKATGQLEPYLPGVCDISGRRSKDSSVSAWGATSAQDFCCHHA